jgi:hypothetical protein
LHQPGLRDPQLLPRVRRPILGRSLGTCWTSSPEPADRALQKNTTSGAPKDRDISRS